MGVLYSIQNEENTTSNSKTEQNICQADNTSENAAVCKRISEDANITTDAVSNTITRKNINQQMWNITLEQVKQMEKELEFYEIVSLVYLLYESPHLALQELKLGLHGVQRNSLSDWVMEQINMRTAWEIKLQEALCIIQNYEVLKSFGQSKDNLIEQFLPHLSFTSLYVNVVKKELYNIFDNLKKDDVKKLLTLVKNDCIAKNKEFKEFDSSLLELFLLHWETEKYITKTNLQNLINIFKQMELYDISDRLKKYSITEEINIKVEENNVHKKTSKKNEGKHNKVFDNYPPNNEDSFTSLFSMASSSNQECSPVSSNDCYTINEKHPGAILIINIKHFYTALEKEFKHLRPKIQLKLEDREGSDIDQNVMEETFKGLGFKIVIKENLEHMEILPAITDFLNSINDESSIFICIMSHGDEGIIYGHNSCYIKVQEIVELMGTENKKNLNDKPKVLILQACQGQDVQKTDEDDDITTDGVNNQLTPIKKDMLIFWATIPGYGAVRNKTSGTWFIQSLCKNIKTYYKTLHLLDICTRVVNDVTNKKWIKNNKGHTMTPYKTDTFKKDFYFPSKIDEKI